MACIWYFRLYHFCLHFDTQAVLLEWNNLVFNLIFWFITRGLCLRSSQKSGGWQELKLGLVTRNGFDNSHYSRISILECPAGTYKNIKGIGNCIPCPEKSTSYAGATNCTCDRGTFRSETDSIDGDCKAPPAPIDTADLTVKRSSSKVQISWPKSDDDVTYR